MAYLLEKVIDEALRDRPTDFAQDHFGYLYERGYGETDLPPWCWGESNYAEFNRLDPESHRGFAPVWYWLVEPVRRVFEELHKDRKARTILLSDLPIPDAPPPPLKTDEVWYEDDVDKTCKSVFGCNSAQIWSLRKDITHPKRLRPEVEEVLRHLAAENARCGHKEVAEVRPVVSNPRAIEAMFGDLGPQPPSSFSSVNGASSPAAKEWAKFHSVFDGPAVHLWGLWKCWPDITGRPGLAPAPEYPGASRLGPQAAAFEQCVARSRFRLISFVDASRNRAAMIWSALKWLQYELLAAAARRRRGRNRGDSEKVRKLTEKQSEAVHIVGECQGNILRAAKQLGRDPSTIRQHYKAAMRKLGRSAVRDKKPAVSAIPADKRGQGIVADKSQGPLPPRLPSRSNPLSDKRLG